MQYDDNISKPFLIKSEVKQGCVLDPTLFGFFSKLLKRGFCLSTVGVKLNTRSYECLFNPARLKAKQKVKTITVRDLIFAYDAEIVAHFAQDTIGSDFLSLLKFWPHHYP